MRSIERYLPNADSVDELPGGPIDPGNQLCVNKMPALIILKTHPSPQPAVEPEGAEVLVGPDDPEDVEVLDVGVEPPVFVGLVLVLLVLVVDDVGVVGDAPL